MAKIAVYPGSFDPVTNGHVDVIRRALNIFDKVIVAVFDNPPKKDVLFTPRERVEMIKNAVNHDNVEVEAFSGLLVDYLKKKNIKFIVRGLRAMSDFDVEFQMAIVNKELDNGVETVFIVTDKKYFYLNSTLIKELSRHGGNIKDLVAPYVENKLREKFGK